MSVADVSDDGPGLRQVLFSPKGRLPRLDTMFAILCVMIVAQTLASLWIGFAAAYQHRQDLEALLTPWVWGPVAIIGLGGTWSVACLLIKRCHDRNRSAWFLLITLVPLVNLWPMIDLFFLPGTPDLNPFGPPPRGMVEQWHAANRDL
ncbi:hypothetical protein GCM10007874_12130 [Labrys miyagiensis]|uniref:DUF805 domain-containing protein n=1 Tax=Labrys miyagiensis TaxID=346912 RepID=A0ABQ6CCW3_9HYPH|nr:DUF805 domain-containing protein [Labrys miyagiensis]GLS18197.1 hypothetical protein GCM10007874_12130 [Labrys miyagiensis]